uniref:Predicted protein n=1 Tax=Hordeum vulgare subsp. vulgare TaxID=112509 RepID=F2EEX9_HORVV|nr:predicted protein [Hordeum vulgare subsp. vulgare]
MLIGCVLCGTLHQSVGRTLASASSLGLSSHHMFVGVALLWQMNLLLVSQCMPASQNPAANNTSARPNRLESSYAHAMAIPPSRWRLHVIWN